MFRNALLQRNKISNSSQIKIENQIPHFVRNDVLLHAEM